MDGIVSCSGDCLQPSMSVFALWPVIFYKNILVFSNTLYFQIGRIFQKYIAGPIQRVNNQY